MNVALLKKIKSRILREPQKFRMDRWSCGTAHCIGGWACVLAKDPPVPSLNYGWTRSGWMVQSRAAEVLDIQGCSHDLFDICYWPDPFRGAYHRARTRKQRAVVAAQRIDHFIATSGRE
jgi:hypothetical protein